jgi:hypothetical protein
MAKELTFTTAKPMIHAIANSIATSTNMIDSLGYWEIADRIVDELLAALGPVASG